MMNDIKSILAKELSAEFGLEPVLIADLFEIPKDIHHGHFSIPVFQLAKTRKAPPPVIAKEIAQKMLTRGIPEISKVESVGGYVNFHFDDRYVFQELYKVVKNSGAKLGHRTTGRGKTLIIDYSSPNVAKPMHVGHLRATVIGQAVRNLAETQGYKVIGLNHLGDWGVQFGKLAYAYEKWGKEFPFEKEPFESLYRLYVRFHEEAEKNPDVEQEGAATFKRLEDGDPVLRGLWQKFVEISMTDFAKQWKRLNVAHDLVRGESFYNDRLAPTESLLEKKGLLVESEGAMVVDLSDEKMPPCLIRKSDGASLYATRDLASAIYRMEELKADVNLYVVGQEQQLHFKQVFSVLRRLGFSWWNQCHHISFGLYRFKDAGKMSSRKGQIIRLDDVLSQAIDQVEVLINEKNPDLADKRGVAEKVGIGAIIFNDLVNDRVRDVEFDWEKVLSFDGDSGPYVQYVYVRCGSILRKYGRDLPLEVEVLDSEEERNLMKTLIKYEDILSASYKNFKPNILAGYLLDVCSAFNQFYQKHRIIGGDERLAPSRIVLVHITREIIRSGLQVLNIQCPEQM